MHCLRPYTWAGLASFALNPSAVAAAGVSSELRHIPFTMISTSGLQGLDTRALCDSKVCVVPAAVPMDAPPVSCSIGVTSDDEVNHISDIFGEVGEAVSTIGNHVSNETTFAVDSGALYDDLEALEVEVLHLGCLTGFQACLLGQTIKNAMQQVNSFFTGLGYEHDVLVAQQRTDEYAYLLSVLVDRLNVVLSKIDFAYTNSQEVFDCGLIAMINQSISLDNESLATLIAKYNWSAGPYQILELHSFTVCNGYAITPVTCPADPSTSSSATSTSVVLTLNQTSTDSPTSTPTVMPNSTLTLKANSTFSALSSSAAPSLSFALTSAALSTASDNATSFQSSSAEGTDVSSDHVYGPTSFQNASSLPSAETTGISSASEGFHNMTSSPLDNASGASSLSVTIDVTQPASKTVPVSLVTLTSPLDCDGSSCLTKTAPLGTVSDPATSASERSSSPATIGSWGASPPVGSSGAINGLPASDPGPAQANGAIVRRDRLSPALLLAAVLVV